MAYLYKIESFADLAKNLDYSDQLLLEHQVLLMHQKIESAQRKLEALYTYRKAHLNIMESLLLPAFQLILKEMYPEGAKPLYFTREKALILKELERVVRQMGDLVLHAKQADIVTIFEDYATFKDLLDHHDAREKAFLFPTLESKLETAKKEPLLREIEKGLQQ